MPRVNLLPPEIAQRRRARALQAGMGGAVAAAVVLVGAGYLMAHSSANSAASDLDAAQAKTTSLQTEAARYEGDQSLRSQLDAKQAMLEDAMGKEVQWSHYLVDLSLRIPNNVWIEHLSITENIDPATTGANTSPVLADPGLGTVTVEGVAFSHDDVAAWLDSLAKQKGYVNPFFTRSEKDFIGPRPVTRFTTTNGLTPDVLSGRYTKPAGS